MFTLQTKVGKKNFILINCFKCKNVPKLHTHNMLWYLDYDVKSNFIQINSIMNKFNFLKNAGNSAAHKCKCFYRCCCRFLELTMLPRISSVLDFPFNSNLIFRTPKRMKSSLNPLCWLTDSNPLTNKWLLIDHQ